MHSWFPLVIAIILGCNGGLIFLNSCKSDNERQTVSEEKNPQEELIRNQQQLIQKESNDIDEYISRRNLTMKTTATGLRYRLYDSGSDSDSVHDDDWVKINYDVSLLDGTAIYNSDSTGMLQFQIGKSDVANGLQEGIKLMKEGDKALFILPAHLAYGLTGDGDLIKHYATLVIHAELVEISSKP